MKALTSIEQTQAASTHLLPCLAEDAQLSGPAPPAEEPDPFQQTRGRPRASVRAGSWVTPSTDNTGLISVYAI